MLLTKHGKHIFHFLNTSAAKRPLVLGQIHRRGVSEMAICDPHAARKAKKKFLTEHEKHNFHFYNPSRLIFTFLARHARRRPAQHPVLGLECAVEPPLTRAGGDDYVSLPTNSVKLIRESEQNLQKFVLSLQNWCSAWWRFVS